MSMPQVKPTSARKLDSARPQRTRAVTSTKEPSPATPQLAQDAQPSAPIIATDVSTPGATAVPSSSSSQTQQHGSLLDQIADPSDLKKLSPDQLALLAKEM